MRKATLLLVTLLTACSTPTGRECVHEVELWTKKISYMRGQGYMEWWEKVPTCVRWEQGFDDATIFKH